MTRPKPPQPTSRSLPSRPRRLKPMKGVAAEAMVLYLDQLCSILLAMMVEMHVGKQVKVEAGRLREMQDKLRNRFTEEVI